MMVVEAIATEEQKQVFYRPQWRPIRIRAIENEYVQKIDKNEQR